MEQFCVGFGRTCVTPALGTGIYGYYKVRLADQILDDVEVNALALSLGETKALVISVDCCYMQAYVQKPMHEALTAATGLPDEAIFLHCTHTHTSGGVEPGSEDPLMQQYFQLMKQRLTEASLAALADLKPARMGWGIGQAPGIAFVRRFRMKDGSIQTNPGLNNPMIEAPIGDVDERVNVLRFDRENDTILLANFGCHPDTVGGCRISADWPGFARRRVEKAMDNVKCLFFNGAEGDINHVNVHADRGDLNGLENDFDDVLRGYTHSSHMGNVVAGAILQVFEKVNYVEVSELRTIKQIVEVPSNIPDPADLPNARRINELHQSGRDDEIPFKGMMLTTVVAEAERMLKLQNGPDSFPMQLTALAIGPVAMFGIPGEPFMQIGRALQQTPGWELVLPCCNTNGAEGYFPTEDAYREGGYEARSSQFRAGVAEFLIDRGQALLGELHG